MHGFIVFLIIATLLIPLTTASTTGAYLNDLSAELKAFEPLIEKTWKGKLSESPEGIPLYDISHWERALNGKAIRVLHSVNNGVYGGESMLLWDEQKKCLVYFYFTTEGFYTSGTMTIENGKFIGYEKATGNKEGISAVIENTKKRT